MLIWQQLLHDADVQRLRTRDAGMLRGHGFRGAEHVQQVITPDMMMCRDAGLAC